MNDLHPTLRLNAAAIRLAKQIYDCRCEAFELHPAAWRELNPTMRQALVESAVACLEQFRVAPAIRPALRLVHADDQVSA